MKNKICVILLFLTVFYVELCCGQNVPNCERQLFDATEIQENQGFINLVESLPGEGAGAVTPIVSNFTIVCFAQGSTQGLYRAASIIATFQANAGGTNRTRQFQLLCFNGQWQAPPGDSFSDDPRPLDPTARFDCFNCRQTSDHNCVACNAACDDMGSERCTGSQSTDCCPFFLNGTCTSGCPTNYTASADFNCACSICNDPGFEPNDDCSDCIVNDICLANNPCMNNGTCTLNNPPDDYTCNCPSGFTGTNCDMEVMVAPTTTSMSMSSSPTPTTSPVCTISNCEACDGPDCCRSCADGYLLNECVCEMPRCTVPQCESCATNRSDCCATCEDNFVKDDCLCVTANRSPTPTSTIERQSGLGGPALAGIIVAIVLGILVLLSLITLIVYLIYYFVVGGGSAAKGAKTNSPFANGESHDNPLYLRPDEVTDGSDNTLL